MSINSGSELTTCWRLRKVSASRSVSPLSRACAEMSPKRGLEQVARRGLSRKLEVRTSPVPCIFAVRPPRKKNRKNIASERFPLKATGEHIPSLQLTWHLWRVNWKDQLPFQVTPVRCHVSGREGKTYSFQPMEEIAWFQSHPVLCSGSSSAGWSAYAMAVLAQVARGQTPLRRRNFAQKALRGPVLRRHANGRRMEEATRASQNSYHFSTARLVPASFNWICACDLGALLRESGTSLAFVDS